MIETPIASWRGISAALLVGSPSLSVVSDESVTVFSDVAGETIVTLPAAAAFLSRHSAKTRTALRRLLREF